MTAEQTLSGLLAGLTPPSAAAAQKAREHWNACAKPLGSLGLLEQAIEQIAGLTGSENGQLTPRRALVFCADNGVVAQGISQSPASVTAAVAHNLALGVTAVCRMGQVAGCPVLPVDMGVENYAGEPGVLNRRTFLEEGAREMKRARRYKRELSVLLMTIDHFEALNSEHGSTFGDEAINVAVTACRNSTRDSDYLGRLADIEFALLLPETPLDGARIVAERIRNEVMKSDLFVNDIKISVTTSISIASKTADDETIDTILLRAFNALRASKDRQNNIAVAE